MQEFPAVACADENPGTQNALVSARAKEQADALVRNLGCSAELTVQEAVDVIGCRVVELLHLWHLSRSIATGTEDGEPDLIREKKVGPTGRSELIIRANTPRVTAQDFQDLLTRKVGDVVDEIVARLPNV